MFYLPSFYIAYVWSGLIVLTVSQLGQSISVNLNNQNSKIFLFTFYYSCIKAKEKKSKMREKLEKMKRATAGEVAVVDKFS